ncbi:MAG: galactokinase family protein, partial [Sporichthyaceae bacterium]
MTVEDGHASVVDAFDRLAGGAPECIWSSPGRVNLIGEHTDYNDGFALPFAIAARAYAAVRRRDDGMLRMASVQLPDNDVTVALDDIAPGTPTGWAAYVAGVVWAAREAGHEVGGMDVLVDGRVPLGSGLSSSHALECAVAAATVHVHGIEAAHDDLARLSLTAENDFVGAPTGMMDQLASLHCTAGHAIFLDNRTLAVEQVPLDVASAGLALMVLDTRVHHDHAEGGYGERR